MTEVASTDPQGLWGSLSIPIIGVSGEFESGKTLFGCTIDPHNTIVYDFEESAATYQGLGIKRRVNIPKEIVKVYPKGYTTLQLYVWWRDHVRSLPAGEFKVCFVDPFSDIEQGFADYILQNPGEQGRTKAQYEKSGGLFWGDAKNIQNMFILDLGSKVETFVFSTHMRDVFRGAAPTGMREPKGKETLMKLATLYLLLERNVNEKGVKPLEPSAIVLKSRLAHTAWIDGKPKIQPILPPRLPVATPEAIRDYIAKPPDYSKLKVGEKVQIKTPTEDERLEKRLQIAVLEEAKEASAKSRMELMIEAAKDQGNAVDKLSGGQAVVVPAVSATPTTTTHAGPTVTVSAAPAKNDIQQGYIDTARTLETQLGMTDENRSKVYAKRGFADLPTAPDSALAEYVTALRKKLQEKTAAPKA